MPIKYQSSVGSYYFNDKPEALYPEEKYKIDYSRRFYMFDVIPMAKPRMTQSDKWKVNPHHPDPKKRQRKPVTEYFAFKNILTHQINKLGFKPTDVFEAVFFVPMPSTWSDKKRKRMVGLPCKTRPDADNYIKAFLDCTMKEDGTVYRFKDVIKIYSYTGCILIYQ